MDPSEQDGNGAPEEALPPPPPVPPNVTPTKVLEEETKKVFRAPMARRGLGTKGNKVPILTNHFKVNVTNVDGQFFHYSVRAQNGKNFSFRSIYFLKNIRWFTLTS